MEKAITQQKRCERAVSERYEGKIYVIIGKAASGKSAVLKDVSKELDIDRIITCTSRPPREGEVNGVDYHFIKYEDFDDSFLAVEEFKGWKYGVRPIDLVPNKDYLIILTPSGYRDFKRRFGDRVFGIYILAPFKDRYERYVERDPQDPTVIEEANRRFKADDIDFYDFEFEVEKVVFNTSSYFDLVDEVSFTIASGGCYV